jgi:dCTP deaminase
MVIETAPWIHPGYRGCLTLEIANVSNTPLILYPGRTIGQLILQELMPGPETDHSEAALSGTYLGPIYPEAPSFNNPVDDLEAIGVLRTAIRLPGTPL